MSLCRHGGLQRMVTAHVSKCMSGTIPVTSTRMVASASCLSAPAKNLCFGRGRVMRVSCGATLSTTADRLELTAPSSETNPSSKAVDSYEKRRRLLIASGLICGGIPMSIRKRSTVDCPEIASLWPDGNTSERTAIDCEPEAEN